MSTQTFDYNPTNTELISLAQSFYAANPEAITSPSTTGLTPFDALMQTGTQIALVAFAVVAGQLVVDIAANAPAGLADAISAAVGAASHPDDHSGGHWRSK